MELSIDSFYKVYLFWQVENESKQHGGQIVADVLKVSLHVEYVDLIRYVKSVA